MLLGLDLGTTNVKALLVTPAGRVVARARLPVHLTHVGADGVEQDIEEIWDATLDAIAQVASEGELSSVQAVGVSAQGGALQVLDGRDRPLGPVISWLDGRAGPWASRLTGELGSDWLAEHVGHAGAGLAMAQILRIREEKPDMLAPPHRLGFVGDVIVDRLCGRRAHDATSLSLGLLYNPRLGRADPALLAYLEIEEELLPHLQPPREPAGNLLASVAESTGLPVGVPVSPAVHDQYAAALGCGAASAGDVMLGAGTAWVLLSVTSDLPPLAVSSAFVCTHLVEGLYGQILSLVNGGSAFEWALRMLGLDGLTAQQATALIDSVPAGADGVRFRPLLAPGGGAGLDPQARGRLDGLRLRHERAHVLRAVEEGLAFELARYLNFLTRSGAPVERLILAGGATGARTPAQIIADVAGHCVERVMERDASALGAAILARALTDRNSNLARLALEMAPVRDAVSPGPDATAYRSLLRQYIDDLPTLDEAAHA